MAEKRYRAVSPLSSLQMKYALSYLSILTVVLVLLNVYPVLASQELLFQSKRESLQRQETVMSSALMEMESLTAERVARVMEMLDSTGLSRVVVTDPSGLILYDSGSEVQEDVPQYLLHQELVSALGGLDVSYSCYQDGVFYSTVTAPIFYRGVIIGGVYLQDIDQEQGALLLNLQDNLRNISVVIAAAALVMSSLFSQLLTRRITELLRAIRIVGDGEYGHQLKLKGNDELSHLATEFNNLSDRLQSTEEVRRRFISDASHELKTPLASICLLTDSILQNESIDDGLMREFVGDIRDQAGRLTRITEHLLVLSRLDSLPAATAQAVDVDEVVRRVFGALSYMAKEREVTLRREIPSGCLVRCTVDELHQICANLVENAIKYNTVKGQVLVYTTPKENELCITVEDTGVGIPEDDLPKVFNRFYRVDKARSRAAGGTGLGLSIVRDTVRRHGGWVEVAPRPGGGTIFTVGLPRYGEEVTP